MYQHEEHVSSGTIKFFFRLLGILFGLCLCAFVLFPLFGRSSDYDHHSCLSNLKQLGTATAIYQADWDDRLPAAFTFDGEKAANNFYTVTIVYMKNPEMYFCGWDKGETLWGQEGIPGKMSYVHSLALKRIIPDYDRGNRSLEVNEKLPNVATTVYLRDPIRFNPKEDKSKLCSPHGEGFNLEFLDTHAKFRKHLDINTEL